MTTTTATKLQPNCDITSKTTTLAPKRRRKIETIKTNIEQVQQLPTSRMKRRRLDAKIDEINLLNPRLL